MFIILVEMPPEAESGARMEWMQFIWGVQIPSGEWGERTGEEQTAIKRHAITAAATVDNWNLILKEALAIYTCFRIILAEGQGS